MQVAEYFCYKIFIYLFISKVAADAEIPTIQCEAYIAFTNDSDDFYYCAFKENITFNESHPHFQPESSGPSTKIKGIFLDGKIADIDNNGLTMHSFTNDICKNFPNVKYITGMNLGLEIIQDNALENCVNLEIIDFSQNNLTHIGPETFKTNVNLNHISLSFNNLKVFDLQSLNQLNGLKYLELAGNHLQDFSVTQVNEMKNLTVLNLSMNDFSDLDVDGIIQKFPELQYITLIDCKSIPHKRFIEIVDQLKSKKINAD